MKKFAIISLILLASVAFADPIIDPFPFLITPGPDRLTQDYVESQLGDSLILFTQPSGGAVISIDRGSYDEKKYFFCDEPLNKIIIITVIDSFGVSRPRSIKSYGRYLPPPTFTAGENDSILSFPWEYRDSVACFNRPIDVAVTSAWRYFDPTTDFIFVLDQGNKRVVALRYDDNLDSLIWVGDFGKDRLRLPTAIEDASYGDINVANHDVYVTDGYLAKIFKFSSSGVFEEEYGGRGESLGALGFPTGIAVSTSSIYTNRFYVSDSKNHRVVRYYSEPTGPIYAERQYTFPLIPYPMIGPLDTDHDGNLYVLDEFNHRITIIAPNFDKVYSVYGSQGYEPGQFDYPSDIYIDKNEMTVCELWADSSGIQSFTIKSGAGKLTSAILPEKFNLYQNYPNPFNSRTTIMFDIAEAGNAELVIYNILGQKINTLIDQQLQPGTHHYIWDGKNASGSTVSSGIYFYRLTSSDKTSIKKLLLLK